jgi:hypothetical protein
MLFCLAKMNSPTTRHCSDKIPTLSFIRRLPTGSWSDARIVRRALFEPLDQTQDQLRELVGSLSCVRPI